MIIYSRDAPDYPAFERLVVQAWNEIAPGVKILDRRLKIGSGENLDFLCVDSEGRFVIADLAIREGDAILVRALRHLAWLYDQMTLLQRAYRNENLADDAAPRLLLIAPGFSSTLRESLSALAGTEVMLISARYGEIQNEPALWVEPIPVPRPISAPPSVRPARRSAKLRLSEKELLHFFQR